MSQKKVGEISVAGKTVPVYAEGKNGQLFVPSQIEREVILDFLGRALATPVTAITIVGGGAWRDIRLTYARVTQDIDVEVYRISMEGERRKMQDILDIYGSALADLSDRDLPEDYKKTCADKIKSKMEARLSKL